MAKSALTKLDTKALLKELKRRQRQLPKLQAKRQKFLAKLSAIDAQIAALGVASGNSKGPGRPAGAGKRHRNEQSLAEAIAKVLKKDKPMGIQQVVDAVLASGYKSTAKNFRMVVSLNLSKDKRFKNVARGQYVLVN